MSRRGRETDGIAPEAAAWRAALAIALVATVYYGTARFGLALHSTVSASVTLIWLPAGVAVVAVLLWGRRMLPGVYAGAFAINATTGDATVPAALAIAAGNTAETFVVVLALRRFGFTMEIERIVQLTPLPASAAAGCAVAATVGTSALELVRRLPPEDWAEAWLTWWLGDVVGIFLIVPVALALAAARRGIHVEPLLEHRVRLAGVEALRRLRERERRRWAKDLNDRTLSALVIAEDALRGLPEREARRAHSILTMEIAALRALIAELRPPPLEAVGLRESVESLAKTLSERYGLVIEARAEIDDQLPPAVEDALYRAAHEALTNAARHSRAEKAELRLVRTDGTVVLEVEDNGVGFEPEHVAGGYGLVGIRARMRAVQGSAEIESAPELGTRVRASCPTDP